MFTSSKIAQTILLTARTTARTTALVTTRSRSRVHSHNINHLQQSNSFQTRAFQTSTRKMGVHNVSSKKEFDSSIKENDIVILDCFATWCGPCKVIAPQVVKFSDEFPSLLFIKLDVDEVPDVAQELGIRAMPTFLIFKGGEKVAEIVGANPAALKGAIEKVSSEKV